jgi:hypothetical protein
MSSQKPRVLYQHQLYKGPQVRVLPRANRRPELTIPQILAWIDDYHREHGQWPKPDSGCIGRFVNDTWWAVENSLAKGYRGLPGGSSLARLLAEKRGVRYKNCLPSLSVQQILKWADAFNERTGEWPKELSGPIPEAPGESWGIVNKALAKGLRGLPKGSSLVQLLAEHRGVRNVANLPPLRVPQILSWAEGYHRRTGEWPSLQSGPIKESPAETWCAVNMALRVGVRGLSGGSSLALLLAEHCGVRNRTSLQVLDHNLILSWADDHRGRTGKWPITDSGSVFAAPGETWIAIDSALRAGSRGLGGGSSLARLLAKERDVRNRQDLSPLNIQLILSWADDHHKRTGKWPTKNCGAVLGEPGEKWNGINSALVRGSRELPGRSSLAKLLAKQRGVKYQPEAPSLRVRKILLWADTHFRHTGRWPTHTSGRISDAPSETWGCVQTALQRGLRGLPPGSSLARLLAKHRRKRNIRALPKLSEDLILGWVDDYHKRTGKWPTSESGAVINAVGETWSGLNAALAKGSRGLPGDSSLAKLLAKYGRKRNRKGLPHLNPKLILIWADAYYKRMGSWPTRNSGSITSAPAETWGAVDAALNQGARGLPGGSSLPRFLRANGRA